MMEAARTSETLVNFYPTTWRYNPEDSHLHHMVHSEVTDGGEGLQIWRIAVNILTKQLLAANKGWSSSFRVEQEGC
jgi:hypothetical protein